MVGGGGALSVSLARRFELSVGLMQIAVNMQAYRGHYQQNGRAYLEAYHREEVPE